MTIETHVQFGVQNVTLPTENEIQHWILVALTQAKRQGSVVIRIVDEQEMTDLNHRYRKKNKATNVLSFPSQMPAPFRGSELGDIVICAPVVEKEASEQHKTIKAHWAHMVIHGALHLLGFDHENESDAAVMEALESQILSEIGFPNPYKVEIMHE